MAAGSESQLSVLTGVLETSSNYCVAEFAGGMTVPKQNIPQNKPWRQSCSGCTAKMEQKKNKIVLNMVEGICMFWICSFFWRRDSQMLLWYWGHPFGKVHPVACHQKSLWSTIKLLLYSLKNEKGCFQKGQMGCDTSTLCISWLQLNTYMQHKTITFLGKRHGKYSSLSDVQCDRTGACAMQLCW